MANEVEVPGDFSLNSGQESQKRYYKHQHMKITLTLFLGALALSCASTTTPVADTGAGENHGYRTICRAPGHGTPEVYVGPARETKLESKKDMLSHADAHHGGSLSQMTYTAPVKLP